MRRLVSVAIALFAGAGLAGPGVSTASATTSGLPPIHHVWIVELENKSYTQALGHGTGYLGQTLPALGQALTSFYATGHASLDNYVAQVSGQAPNIITQTDCVRYMDVLPGLVGPGGQAIGEGCVYPSAVKTVVDQLHASGLTWKGYMEDMGNSPTRDHTNARGNCGHPLLNSSDGTQSATSKDQYASRHNPFVYFHSIIDTAQCDNVVPQTRLAHDLATTATTPNYSWVSPNLCNDGHDTGCAGVDVAGKRDGGLVSTNRWLSTYIPMILNSPAYKADGALFITWDESDTADTASCCGATPGLGSPLPGITGPGGGHIATLVISQFTKPGTTNPTPYNQYAMLRSVEDIFGLAHLGEAGASGLKAFGADVFNGAAATSPVAPHIDPLAPPPPPTRTVRSTTTQLPATGGHPGWPLGAGVALLAALLAARAWNRSSLKT